MITGIPHYGLKKIVPGYEGVYEQIINGVKIYRIKEHIRCDSSLKTLFKNYLSILIRFPQKLKQIKGDFDIVLSHVMSPIFTMVGIKSFCRKHKIPHIHYGFDLWPESLIATGVFKRDSFAFRFMKIVSRRLYSSIDTIVFASPSTKTYFHDYLKLPLIKFKQIYQPTYTELPNKHIIENHKYKSGRILKILFAGSIVRFNKLELMIHALSLCESKHNIEFHILGSGSEGDNVHDLVLQKQMNNVFFHGRVPSNQTIDYLINADVLFIPLTVNSKTSLMIPQKVLEYLMYGRPILGMLQGDGRDILERASQGNVFAEESVFSLSKAIDSIYAKSEKELEKIGNENRNFFENEPRFQFDTIKTELLTEIETLVHQFRER